MNIGKGESELRWASHDIDDGIRANLFTLDDLSEIGLIKKHLDKILDK